MLQLGLYFLCLYNEIYMLYSGKQDSNWTVLFSVQVYIAIG